MIDDAEGLCLIQLVSHISGTHMKGCSPTFPMLLLAYICYKAQWEVIGKSDTRVVSASP